MHSTTQHSTIIGWDIGGAHVKAALTQNDAIKLVTQVACPLWRGLDELISATQHILKAWQLVDTEVLHAITMTGELVDLFPNRQTGVMQIAETMQAQLTGTCWYYQCDATKPALVDWAQLGDSWESIASANWHASTTLIAQQVQSGLFIDIGSTTSDIIVMHANQLHNQGHTDATRLRTGELVYTGVVRTPLMALGPTIDWRDAVQPLAAEHFATSADVYRMIGQLSPESDMADTADGNDKTQQATAIRLARMVGHDVEDYPIQAWVELAEAFKAKQVAMLADAIQTQLDRLLTIAPQLKKVQIVSAGVGGFLVKEVIAELLQNRHYPEMQSNQSDAMLSQMHIQPNQTHGNLAQEWAGHCLPAVAVALLATQAGLAAFEHD